MNNGISGTATSRINAEVRSANRIRSPAASGSTQARHNAGTYERIQGSRASASSGASACSVTRRVSARRVSAAATDAEISVSQRTPRRTIPIAPSAIARDQEASRSPSMILGSRRPTTSAWASTTRVVTTARVAQTSRWRRSAGDSRSSSGSIGPRRERSGGASKGSPPSTTGRGVLDTRRWYDAVPVAADQLDHLLDDEQAEREPDRDRPVAGGQRHGPEH